MKRMKGKKVFMSVKIDLEKAYDILNWRFVTQCLQDYKLPKELINIIYHRISSTFSKSYRMGISFIVLLHLEVFIKVTLYLLIFLLFVWIICRILLFTRLMQNSGSLCVQDLKCLISCLQMTLSFLQKSIQSKLIISSISWISSAKPLAKRYQRSL